MRIGNFSPARVLAGAFAALIIGLASGCSGRPSGVLPPDKMARLLADIHVGEAVAEQSGGRFSSDSMKLVLRQSIFEHNGVDATTVDSSLAWYGRNLDKYAEVYELIVEDLETRQRDLREASATQMDVREVVAFEAEGDSVDIWPLYRQRVFSPRLPDDHIAFNIRSDRNWESGDIYQLRFKLVNPRHAASASIVAEYTDGYAGYVGMTPVGEGWHTLTLALSPNRTASEIYGVISYSDDPALLDGEAIDRLSVDPTMVDSVSLVRMRSAFPGAPSPSPSQRELRIR